MPGERSRFQPRRDLARRPDFGRAHPRAHHRREHPAPPRLLAAGAAGGRCRGACRGEGARRRDRIPDRAGPHVHQQPRHRRPGPSDRRRDHLLLSVHAGRPGAGGHGGARRRSGTALHRPHAGYQPGPAGPSAHPRPLSAAAPGDAGEGQPCGHHSASRRRGEEDLVAEQPGLLRGRVAAAVLYLVQLPSLGYNYKQLRQSNI